MESSIIKPKIKRYRAQRKNGPSKHLTTQVWVQRSQSLPWPSANAAKTRGTSPNLNTLGEMVLAHKIMRRAKGNMNFKTLSILLIAVFAISCHNKTNTEIDLNRKIATINVYCLEVERDISLRKIKIDSTKSNTRSNYSDAERYLSRNTDGKIVKYTRVGGSSYSYRKIIYYYNAKEEIVQVLVKAFAFNGAEYINRIYFSNNKRIFENAMYSTIDTFYFPNPWPEDDIIFNPAEHYQSIMESNINNKKFEEIEPSVRMFEGSIDSVVRILADHCNDPSKADGFHISINSIDDCNNCFELSGQFWKNYWGSRHCDHWISGAM
jgi:hypothetical protein